MKTTSRKLTVAWPLVILLLLPALTRSESAVQTWVQRYNGPWNGASWVDAIAVDGSNNVIVTGASKVSGPYDYDYATIKYSSAGLPLWTNVYNGPANGNDFVYAIAVDGSNNVIVTGSSTGAGSSYDYATIKYSSDGVPVWTNLYNGPANGSSGASAVAVDGNNDVIVTGGSIGSRGKEDYATIKYSSSGASLWTNRYNGPGSGDNWAVAVAVDGSNDVIVTGTSASTFLNPQGNYTDDYATIKYSSAGVPLWTNRYNGPGNGDDFVYAIAVDGSNNVIVTGMSTGSESDVGYATIKYSSAGLPLWTNRYSGPVGSDVATAVAVDGSNNVIVAGYSAGYSRDDYATIKYSSAGYPLWTNRYDGPANGDDSAFAVAVDKSGNVIVTGDSVGNGSDVDYATIKYSSAGLPLWTNRYNGPGGFQDNVHVLAVDHMGNVIVAGGSYRNEIIYDFATIKYICVSEPVMTALHSTNGTFQMRVDDVLQPGTLVIEASTNLGGWLPVFTNTTPTNVLFYTDPTAGSRSNRYYRAFQYPNPVPSSSRSSRTPSSQRLRTSGVA